MCLCEEVRRSNLSFFVGHFSLKYVDRLQLLSDFDNSNDGHRAKTNRLLHRTSSQRHIFHSGELWVMERGATFGKLGFDLWLFYFKNDKNTEGPLPNVHDKFSKTKLLKNKDQVAQLIDYQQLTTQFLILNF
jgi:hypothetical protein